jgi:hypothetical protein
VQGVGVDEPVPQGALDHAGRTRVVLVHVPALPDVEPRPLALQRHAQRPLQVLVGDPRPGGSLGGQDLLAQSVYALNLAQVAQLLVERNLTSALSLHNFLGQRFNNKLLDN